MSEKLNEDQVLRSFYEQRKNRTRTAKRHSLLQKNLSYFSQKDDLPAKQNASATFSSHKYLSRKKNLQQYEHNLKEITQSINNIKKTNNKQYDHESSKNIKQSTEQSIYRHRFRSPDIGIKLNTEEQSQGYRSPKFNMADENMQQKQESCKYNMRQQFEENRMQQYETLKNSNQKKNKLEISTVNMNSGVINNDSLFLETMKNSHVDYHQRVSQKVYGRVNSEENKQIQALKQKIEKLERENRKQNKFIESLYKMRRTLEKTQTDCNLKELWRWIKQLPSERIE